MGKAKKLIGKDINNLFVNEFVVDALSVQDKTLSISNMVGDGLKPTYSELNMTTLDISDAVMFIFKSASSKQWCIKIGKVNNGKTKLSILNNATVDKKNNVSIVFNSIVNNFELPIEIGMDNINETNLQYYTSFAMLIPLKIDYSSIVDLVYKEQQYYNNANKNDIDLMFQLLTVINYNLKLFKSLYDCDIDNSRVIIHKTIDTKYPTSNELKRLNIDLYIQKYILMTMLQSTYFVMKHNATKASLLINRYNLKNC